MIKRFLALCLAFAAAMPLLAGCRKNNTNDDENPNPTDTPTVSLRVWGAQDDQSMIREMCDAFAKAHPEKKYTFSYGVVGEGEAKNIFLDDPDAAADVFHFAGDQIADLVSAGDIPIGEDVVRISAATGAGMENLLQAIEKMLGHSRHHVILTLPYSMGGMVEKLHDGAQVLNVEYTGEGICVEAILDPIFYGRVKDYVTKEC